MRDGEARHAVLALLARGLVTMAEAAQLAAVSRQLLHHWVKVAGVDHKRVRRRVLARLWRKEMRRGPKLVEREPAQIDARPWE